MCVSKNSHKMQYCNLYAYTYIHPYMRVYNIHNNNRNAPVRAANEKQRKTLYSSLDADTDIISRQREHQTQDRNHRGSLSPQPLLCMYIHTIATHHFLPTAVSLRCYFTAGWLAVFKVYSWRQLKHCHATRKHFNFST